MRAIAFFIASYTICDVSGWPECAFTTTGQPAASADAVSPPAVENAKGKLLAPNTTIGPSGTSIFLMSGFGKGCLSGNAVSIEASTQLPSRTIVANDFNCIMVLPL